MNDHTQCWRQADAKNPAKGSEVQGTNARGRYRYRYGT